MADFSKFKIGNTSYNVKDAAAGKSLSISGTDLSLKNAAGTAISTVTLPSGGGGKFVWFTGMSSSNTMSIQMVVDEAGTAISTFQAMRMAANIGSYVFLVDGAFSASGTIYTLTSIEKVQGSQPIEYTITFSGKDGKWVGQCADTANLTSLTLNFISGGGSSAITSLNIYCPNASLWNVASTQPTTIQVEDVIIDGQIGQLLDLGIVIQKIADKFSTAVGTDLKISITGGDWSAEVLSYSINSSTVTIYFEVFAGSQMYKRYASFNSSSPTSLSLVQAQ
jgi:hypothetical protein